MARPLRNEAARTVYHVMARGDGWKNVFDNDKDRYAWTDLMKKAHGRFGWRVHAWVLMGNHLHFLLEMPEPNRVAGMKWVPGVFSQGWNRRRGRGGHVFQGRYPPSPLAMAGQARRWWPVARRRMAVVSKSWRTPFISIRCAPAGWAGIPGSVCGAGGGAVSARMRAPRQREVEERERSRRGLGARPDRDAEPLGGGPARHRP